MTAMAEMYGIPRFVLFGICAGADNSIATALVDERVAGIILIDPPTHPTQRSRFRYLYTRVAKRGRPQDVVRWGVKTAERGLQQVMARLRGGGELPARASGKREAPPLPVYRAQWTGLVERGVRILAIFSGIHGAGYNHPEQLFEWFPALRGRIEHAYFSDANHTFTELTVQVELIDTVTRWMAKNFG
jgi:pimeloyl-ACP methyl ester carboxylesterase